jgi:predicted PolB exonuclease-like 3'-5' exonuclease
MNYIKRLDLTKIAFIDIETCAKTENYDDLSEAGKLAWQYKNKNEGEIPDSDELNSLFKRTAALYAEFNKIIAVGIGYWSQSDQTFRIKTISSDSESEVLVELGEILEKLYDNKFTLCAHAGKYFDYPQLVKAYQSNSLKVPKMLDVLGAKPWEIDLLDTNEMYKSAFTGPGSSLIALCYHLDIPSPKGDIDGSMVNAAYYDGRLEDITQYVSHDVLATFNIVKRLRLENIVLYDDILLNVPPPSAPDLQTTVVMVSKVKGKKQMYQIQGDDNEDYTVKSSKPIKKDMVVLANFNEKQNYFECVN